MVQQSITAKVRPLSHPSLEKKNLLGAARLYVSKDSLIALTNGLESNKPCVVERLQLEDDDPATEPIRREALLCVLPEKNISPNVVMMTRVFQEATGFKLGDQVRIAMRETSPDVEEVVVRACEPEADAEEWLYPGDWKWPISTLMDEAEHLFPGMVLKVEGTLRAKFKVVRVNGQRHSLGCFRRGTSTIRILKHDEDDNAAAAPTGNDTRKDLVVTGIPGLAKQVTELNSFLEVFGSPFQCADERQSCAFVVHGGHGTGKTLILKRLAATGWGVAHWIRLGDKLSAIRETFKQASASRQPSIILIDDFEDLISKDRANRDGILQILAQELDALSAKAHAERRLPDVVVVVACLDYMLDVPIKMRSSSRLHNNVALSIPRAPERCEILEFLNPPLREVEREACLANIASRAHAYNGGDLAALDSKARDIMGRRLRKQAKAASQDTGEMTEPQEVNYMEVSDMEEALAATRPTAMNDINLDPPTVHWNDIGGQEKLKKVLSRMIKNAKGANSGSRRVLQSPHKGLLLYGPPGCSKTLSAQAMATESSFNFFAVKGAELLNMYVGESERALRNLFERATAAAPSIIFFDEIDSIGGQRSPGGGGSRSNMSVNMLNTLLTEMDGFESLKGVLVLAATNRPDAMDPALLRPGRFDQIVYVGPPDEAAREGIFAVHLRGLSLAENVDFKELARLSEGYSGAEIKSICVEAGTAVLDLYEDTNEEAPLEIAMQDLEAAMERTPRNITKFMTDSYESWSKQRA